MKRFIEILKEEEEKALSSKTSWGKNERFDTVLFRGW